MTLRERFFLIVACGAIIFSLYAWFREKPQVNIPPTPHSGELTPVPNSKPTGTIKCPEGGIRVVTGPTVTIDTSPNWIIGANKDEVTIASGVVPPWEANTHVWTYMNLENGNSRMVFEQQPIEPKPIQKRKFFEWVDKKEIGLFYGYGNNGRVVQLYGQWELLRTGSFSWKTKIESNIEDSKLNAHLLIGGAYQW